ncbi:hypothetical protein HYV74_02310 [Candidatus Uhrbacteria bacterium]|nr:hypothetical protein [Candidatus Uhrbacteria bacterium]
MRSIRALADDVVQATSEKERAQRYVACANAIGGRRRTAMITVVVVGIALEVVQLMIFRAAPEAVAVPENYVSLLLLGLLLLGWRWWYRVTTREFHRARDCVEGRRDEIRSLRTLNRVFRSMDRVKDAPPS